MNSGAIIFPPFSNRLQENLFFCVSNQVRFEPDYSATETSQENFCLHFTGTKSSPFILLLL